MKHLAAALLLATAPAFAQAPAPYSAVIDCGSLQGDGAIQITINGRPYLTAINCGRRA